MSDKSHIPVLLEELNTLQAYIQRLQAGLTPLGHRHQEAMALLHREEQELLAQAGVIDAVNDINNRKAAENAALKDQQETIREHLSKAQFVQQYLTSRLRELQGVISEPSE